MTMQIHAKWLTTIVLLLATTLVNAASVSPSSSVMQLNASSTIKISKIKGTASLTNSNTGIVTATLTTTSSSSGTIQVTSLAIGSATLTIKDRSGSKTVAINVKQPMTISPSSLSLIPKQVASLNISNATGSILLSNSNSAVASASLSSKAIKVTAKTAGTTIITIKDKLTTLQVAVTVTSVTTPNLSGNTNGRLLASNCFQCHGTNGSGGFDDLIGKSDIYSELREFLNGSEDPDGIMAAHLKGYTQQQLEAISDFFVNP